MKKTFQSLGRESGLSYGELQTTLQLAANLANEHPIDAKVRSHEDTYIKSFNGALKLYSVRFL